MRFIKYQIFLISVFIISCDKPTASVSLSKSDIKHPLVVDYRTDDSLTHTAWKAIRDELSRKNEPVDSMFISSVELDSGQQMVTFYVIHFDTFLLMRKLEIQDSINQANPNSNYLITFPPTGNWSGHDRTIIYRVQDGELIDLLNM